MFSRLFFFASLLLAANFTVSTAVGYIHFPPMTLPKMCRASTHIRVLSVKKFDKEKQIIVFDDVAAMKGGKSLAKSFRHVVRGEARESKPILDWAKEDRQAVMFSIEGGAIACGYVFIDEYCYSVDYNRAGEYWLMIRGEPNMSACYDGSVKELRALVKDALDGKEIKPPVKESAAPSKDARDRRVQEVTDVLKRNRGQPSP